MAMKPPVTYISLAALIIHLLLCGPNYADEHKTAELNRKLAEISSLQQSLSQKISSAMQKQEQLEQEVDELEKEIKQEKEQLQSDSYLQAIRNPRIEFNLRLMQMLFGYITGLTHKIRYFQNGYQTLDFFRQQVQDDLLMIKTLNDMEIDTLVAQINSVIDEFDPELSRPVFDTGDISSEDTERIWNQIIQQQNTKG